MMSIRAPTADPVVHCLPPSAFRRIVSLFLVSVNPCVRHAGLLIRYVGAMVCVCAGRETRPLRGTWRTAWVTCSITLRTCSISPTTCWGWRSPAAITGVFFYLPFLCPLPTGFQVALETTRSTASPPEATTSSAGRSTNSAQ